jgi:ABC-type Fe3+/spermidine/putrescine transport system ATPase subunit
MSFDLELINVCKVYPGGQQAVSGFNLQAKRGEFISIIGPSGCGKTTTLRMIAGFEEISSGQVLVRGKDISRLPPEDRPTSTIFQNFALFPHLTVRENIAFGLQVRRLDPGEMKRRIERMVALFDLGDVADRRGAALSGGQRQRVALARGLAVQPDILLLDEPLGALDANLRKSIQHELKLLQREVGITFVFVTHAQSEALVLSDRIVVMNRGHIEQIAPPLALYTSPQTEFVARFMGRNALFRGTVAGSQGAVIDVATASGPLRGTAEHRHHWAEGAPALLVVPSEAFDITAQAPDAAEGRGAGLPARVTGRTYCGQTVRLALEVGEGRAVSIERPVHLADALPDQAQVWLSWPADEARVIEVEAA